MIAYLRYCVFVLVTVLFAGRAYAQFPYNESFRNATASGIVFGGAPSAFLTAGGSSAAGGTPIDLPGSGYLRLTNNNQSQKGYIYSQSDFPSNYGLKVEFEYYIYGGSGADGITFFLFDASANPFNIGGFGGSLGYAQINTTDPVSPGVSKGYLGVGLDEFGNYSFGTEGRQGGEGSQRPGAVALRGKGDGAAMIAGNYQYLIGKKTTDMSPAFNLTDGVKETDPTKSGYRKVYIELKPNPVVGFDITVIITTGGTPQVPHTVINNYHYNEPAPALLRYGLASSTGNQTNFHEIRNVDIRVYNEGALVAPAANNDPITACLGQTFSFNPLSNDVTSNPNASINGSKLDLDPVASGIQSSKTVAGKGTFNVIDATGNVTFTPLNSGVSGPITLSYQVSDTYNAVSNVATVNLTDAPPPSGIDGSAGTDQLKNVSTASATATLSAAPSSLPPGAVGTWSLLSGPAATIATPGSLNTNVNLSTYGNYVFRWSVKAGLGCEVFDDVQVRVNAIPVAVNDTYATAVGTDILIPILDNDTDANSGDAPIDKTTVVIKNPPVSGTIIVDAVGGKVNYRPNPGFTGSDSFVYTVKDVLGAESNLATATITVSVLPIGNDDLMSTASNIPVSYNVKTNDASQAGTTVFKKTDPLNGTISVNLTGAVTYTPNPNFHGFDSFTYVLRNSSGLESAPITVDVVVKPAGEADETATDSNTPVIITVLTNDPSKTGSNVVKKTDPVHGAIVVNTDGTIRYTPTTDYNGTDNFTYFLRDANGLESDPISVTINIRPKGTNDDTNTNLNTPVIIAVKDNDLSKTATTVVKKTDPAHGTATVNPDGTVTYTPANSYQGNDSFTYALRNSGGLESSPITVTILIKPRLLTSPDAVVTNLNASINIPVKSNDGGAAGATVLKQTDPAHGSVALNPDGSFTYSPIADYYGPDSFTYILKDAGGVESDPTTVTIGVRPGGSNDTYFTPLNTAAILQVKDNDVSKTGTTVIRQTDPAHGTAVVTAQNAIVYTPINNYSGIDNFTYILRNTDGLQSDVITVTLNIRPLGSNDLAGTPMNQAVSIPVKDNDASKTGTLVNKKTNPAHGLAAVNPNNTVTYTPSTDFHGKDSFTYTLKTADDIESDEITVVINVRPTGTGDNAVTGMGTPVVVKVKDNDPGKTGTTILKKTDPLHGTMVINPDGTVTYTPVGNYIGPDSFTYSLLNADGIESDPIVATLEVRNLPVAGPDILPAVTGTPIKFNPLTNDTGDGPIDPKTVVITSPPLHGTITVDPVTGEITYTPFPNYSGPDEFTYTVKDNKGLESRPGRVAITVTSPKIGVAKKLLEAKQTLNGTYDVKYLFTIVNYSPFVLRNISLKDDLAGAFMGAEVKVTNLTHQGTLVVNNNFNGITNIDLLSPGGSIINALGEEQVELTINVKLISRAGTFNNAAFVEAINDVGTKVTDQSTDGLRPDPNIAGDVTPSAVTSVDLKINPLFIPGGFSPNGDGINDYFVIQNALDKSINLEMYNRWNNLVYRSKEYNNDWGGKTTEGIHLGDDVPAGTYYYVIIVGGKDKYVGFITINR